MLDETREADTSSLDERRGIEDYLLPVAFLAVAAAAMIAWIAAIGWASWRLMTWFF
ncbi:hypothetical protein [Bradyrhizobium sp. LCT2]|uniref:hypothetical protein n=1 Tax=Bradyrhizobium sp. LCT2 TaxID=2493093 RepID=UPI00137525A5|nr:hypothetical protein [Bradyrhizobium sp. LCT2]